MNKELLTIESELQRLNENLSAVRQIRHILETRVFALDFPKEHYTETIGILINKKASFLSLYSGYFGSERNEIESEIINLSPETKMLHNELKTAYKETADYITELITIAKEKAELAPSENPEDDLLRKMIPKINSDIFHFSTEQQWKDFKNGNFLDLKIAIKQTTQLQKAVAVIDEIIKKLNIGITITEIEQYNVFTYKGKTLKYTQYRDARNKIQSSRISHYFE